MNFVVFFLALAPSVVWAVNLTQLSLLELVQDRKTGHPFGDRIEIELKHGSFAVSGFVFVVGLKSINIKDPVPTIREKKKLAALGMVIDRIGKLKQVIIPDKARRLFANGLRIKPQPDGGWLIAGLGDESHLEYQSRSTEIVKSYSPREALRFYRYQADLLVSSGKVFSFTEVDHYVRNPLKPLAKPNKLVVGGLQLVDLERRLIQRRDSLLNLHNPLKDTIDVGSPKRLVSINTKLIGIINYNADRLYTYDLSRYKFSVAQTLAPDISLLDAVFHDGWSLFYKRKTQYYVESSGKVGDVSQLIEREGFDERLSSVNVYQNQVYLHLVNRSSKLQERTRETVVALNKRTFELEAKLEIHYQTKALSQPLVYWNE